MSDSLSDLLGPTVLNPELVRVGRESVRARRSWRAVALVYSVQVVASVVIGWPIYAFIRRSLSSLPNGDAALFEPGGWILTSLAMKPGAWDALLITGLLLSVGIAWVVGRLAFGVLVASLSFAKRDASVPTNADLVPIAIHSFWPHVKVMLLLNVLKALLLALGVMLGAAASSIEKTYGDARGDQAMLFVFLFFALFAMLVGLLEDIAECAVVRFRLGALDAIRVATLSLRTRPTEMLWAWGWRALSGVILIALGAFSANQLSGRAGFPLVVLLVCHQGVAAGKLLLRTAWFAKAIRVLRHR